MTASCALPGVRDRQVELRRRVGAMPYSGSARAVAAGEDAAVVAEDAVVAGAAGDPVVARSRRSGRRPGLRRTARRCPSCRRSKSSPDSPCISSAAPMSRRRAAGVVSPGRPACSRASCDRARPRSAGAVAVVVVVERRGRPPCRPTAVDVAVVADDHVGVARVAVAVVARVVARDVACRRRRRCRSAPSGRCARVGQAEEARSCRR